MPGARDHWKTCGSTGHMIETNGNAGTRPTLRCGAGLNELLAAARVIDKLSTALLTFVSESKAVPFGR